MNILLCSYSFSPTIGGIETVSQILAREFVRAGHRVTIVTKTPGDSSAEDFVIIRRPGWNVMRRLANSADIIFQNNISLQFLVPTLLTGKPLVVAHHTWLQRTDGKFAWQDRIKRMVLMRCENISVSHAIAASLPVRSVIIPNPYDDLDFSLYAASEKTRDVVFMGRLVSDKGCDQALYALAKLRDLGIRPTFSIIGDGEDKPALLQLTKKLALDDQVTFLGALRETRGQIVAQHKIMIIPSIWNEPFGLVALEGISAGCAILGSASGGLPEAIGPCGLLYRNGDLQNLVEKLRRLLEEPNLRLQLAQNAPEHLARFQSKTVAAAYLKHFEELVADSSGTHTDFRA
jgi:glycogen synthase